MSELSAFSGNFYTQFNSPALHYNAFKEQKNVEFGTKKED
jgi:hypothetical protein